MCSRSFVFEGCNTANRHRLMPVSKSSCAWKKMAADTFWQLEIGKYNIFRRPVILCCWVVSRGSGQSSEWTSDPGPRIVPSCHPGWGAVSDLGGSFAERGFKMGHRHSGTTTRAKTAPFQLSFHTLIFRCFVLIPSLCLLSASFFPLC